MQANQPSTLTAARLGMLLGAAVAIDGAMYNWPKYVAAAILALIVYVLAARYVEWVLARNTKLAEALAFGAPFFLMLLIVAQLKH